MENQTFDEIKNEFKQNYNTAIQFYNEGNWKVFYNHYRPAIEYFCRLIVFDLTDNDNRANELINDQWRINDHNGNYYSTPDVQKENQNTRLVDLARRVIYRARSCAGRNWYAPELLSQDQKHLKGYIDSMFGTGLYAKDEKPPLKALFSKSSELGHHSGKSSLEAETHVSFDVRSLKVCFDYLKDILSAPINELLGSLDEPKDLVTPPDSDIMASRNKSHALVFLDEIWKKIQNRTDISFIIFLPDEVKDNEGHLLSEELKESFFKFPWRLVVDWNTNTDDGLYLFGEKRSLGKRIIVNGSDPSILDSAGLKNWFFARGNSACGEQVWNDKEIRKKTPKGINNILKTMCSRETKDIWIFDFSNGYSEPIIKTLEQIYNGDHLNRFTIVSCSMYDNHYQEMSELKEDYDWEALYIERLSLCDFLTFLKQKLGNERSGAISCMVGEKELIQELPLYDAVGIEFYNAQYATSVKREWNFYQGSKISLEELRRSPNVDVERDQYCLIKQDLQDKMKMSGVKTLVLKHSPGAGGTTLARRIGFDIQKEAIAVGKPYIVVDITKYDSINEICQLLQKLSTTETKRTILAIVEVQADVVEKLDYLKREMGKAKKDIVFFQIEPCYDLTKQDNPKDGQYLLSNDLTDREKEAFNRLYKTLGLSQKKIDDLNRQPKVSVYDYPLSLYADLKEISDDVKQFVKRHWNRLPDELKEVAAMISFAYYYGKTSVKQVLLKDLWFTKTKYHSLNDYGKEYPIKELLLEELTEDNMPTGCWRPRYYVLAKYILRAYRPKWDESADEGVAVRESLALQFIDNMPSQDDLGENDKELLYRLFVNKPNSAGWSDKDRPKYENKFSQFIGKDILPNWDASERIFSKLTLKYADDAMFLGQYGRILYEDAHSNEIASPEDRLFQDAKEKIDTAIEINPDNGKLYHMRGMLYRRMIVALRRQFEDEHKEDLRDSIEEKLQDWCDLARESFDESIERKPDEASHGYTSLCQLWWEVIRFAHILKNCESDDYSFCFESEFYRECLDFYNKGIVGLEDWCHDVNSGDSDFVYEEYIKASEFYRQITGDSAGDIEYYDKKRKEASTDKLKVFYAKRQVDAILNHYCSIDDKTTQEKIRKIAKKKQRKEYEDILNYLAHEMNDTNSFRKLFMLKRYERNGIDLDAAIALLERWKGIYEDPNKKDPNKDAQCYLDVCFFLTICYTAKAIKGEARSEKWIKKSYDGFRETRKWAEKLDKGIGQRYYLGPENDIHCILDIDQEDEAQWFTGTIDEIEKSKGKMKLNCGVSDITFINKEMDFSDLHQPIRGKIGFKYMGLGLYKGEILRTGKSKDETVSDEIAVESGATERKAISNGSEIIGKSDSLNESGVPQHAVAPNNSALEPMATTEEQVEKVDNSTRNENVADQGMIYLENPNPYVEAENGYWYEVDKKDGYRSGFEPLDDKNFYGYDYVDGQAVFFEKKKYINKNGKGSWHAINIRPADEED